MKLFTKIYSYINVEYEAKITKIHNHNGTHFVTEIQCDNPPLYQITTITDFYKIESNLYQMLRDFNKRIKQNYATDFENLMERLEFEQKF
jgi:hypothetical protein